MYRHDSTLGTVIPSTLGYLTPGSSRVHLVNLALSFGRRNITLLFPDNSILIHSLILPPSMISITMGSALGGTPFIYTANSIGAPRRNRVSTSGMPACRAGLWSSVAPTRTPAAEPRPGTTLNTFELDEVQQAVRLILALKSCFHVCTYANAGKARSRRRRDPTPATATSDFDNNIMPILNFVDGVIGSLHTRQSKNQ